MTTARSALRQRAAELIGDYRALSTTAQTLTTATLITAAALADYAEDLDSFPFWWVGDWTDATNSGLIRPILRTNGNTSTTTLAMTRALTGAVASGANFALYRYEPTLYNNSLNRAAEHLFHKGLYLSVRDETLVVDDILTNSDFESAFAGGAHPNWTNALGGGTLTAETTRVRHGTQSAGVDPASGAAAQIYQAPTINIHQVTGKRIICKFWVYTTAASAARIRLSFDGGTTFTNSSYHTGEDRWELLNIETDVPSTATSIRVYLEVAAGSNTAYFDAGWCYIRPIYRYTLPSALVMGRVHQLLMQEYEDHPDGPYYPISDENQPLSGRRLRVLGKNYLTRPSTESGTMEVTGDQADLVCYQALAFLFQALASTVASAERQGYLENGALWQQRADEVLRARGVLPPPLTAAIPQGWRVERDGTTYRLELTHDRG